MALPINIEDLLKKQRVESNRIEFKKGWNPTSIYHSICAFANDIDNLGGGYILIGVEELNGVAIRPVRGIPIQDLDKIQKSMVGFNHMIEPFYSPRISVFEIDNQNILAIWVPSGLERPYTVPEDVTARIKKPAYYIRYGTSSIIAKGEQMDMLREMATKIPFDDRGNSNIKINDISLLQIRDYLTRINSSLAQDTTSMPMEDLLDSMELLSGPSEKRLIKNVAAMMFCEHLYKIFPYSQVEIVLFPEGREQNPDNMIEAPIIRGTVTHMINATLDYLRTNIIKERIIKPSDNEVSKRFFNYPYQALEESVTNALYHRDYKLHEPVEITIEPDRISILSYAGPDRSITMEAIHKASSLRARRYRNRRLGDFLKELNLTEGRATGIPTIQKALKDNGSPRAKIETDEDRTYFLIDIPCHSEFESTLSLTLSESQIKHLEQVLSQVLSQVKSNNTSDLQGLANNLSQAMSQVLNKVMTQAWTPHQFIIILQLMITIFNPKSMKEIVSKMPIKNRMRLMNQYLKPLLETKIAEMTYPESSRHPKQQYKLTKKGFSLLSNNVV
jgi:ATP-dependent DNA helicase RecG